MKINQVEGEENDMIGEKLKEARLAKGITIDELQQKTKIQKRYLEAIEIDDYEAMPGTFYVRNFIRQYAEAVGLNGDEAVRMFDKRNQPKVVETNEVTEKRTAIYQEEEESFGHKFKQKTPLMILFLAVAVIAGVIIYLTFKETKVPMIQPQETVVVDDSDQEDSTESEEKQSETTDSTDEATDSTDTETSSTSSDKEKTDLTVTPIDGNNLKVEAKNVKNPAKITITGEKDSCWLGVLVNGAYIYEHTVQAGETIDIPLPENAEEAQLNIGAALNVSAKLNGQTINLNPNGVEAYKRMVDLSLKYKE